MGCQAPGRTRGWPRSTGTTYIVDGIQPHGEQNTVSLNNYTTVDAAGINTTFDIELPYSIPSDGQQHTVAIKDYELPATYRHFAVPKLDKNKKHTNEKNPYTIYL